MTAYEPSVNQSSLTGNETYKTINPLLSKVGDFTLFYITISICSVIFGLLIILNIVCCCSRYADYWLERHTGNRCIVSIWSAPPHELPPLDFTELQRQYDEYSVNTTEYDKDDTDTEHPASVSRQPLTASQEQLELQNRESEI